MQPHLAPEDIDFLLDGDEGFGLLPLRKHVAGCDDCRARLDEARAMTNLIEHLPHSLPSAAFADGVMARVNVFEPWYVTAADSVRRFAPRVGPWRSLFAVGSGLAAVSLSALTIWVALRIDLAIYAVRLGWTRVQGAAVTAFGSIVSGIFGDSALDALRDGGLPTLLLGVAGLLVVLGTATLGFKGLVRVSRSREH